MEAVDGASVRLSCRQCFLSISGIPMPSYFLFLPPDPFFGFTVGSGRALAAGDV